MLAHIDFKSNFKNFEIFLSLFYRHLATTSCPQFNNKMISQWH